MHQANTGMYRIQPAYLQEYRRTLERQQQQDMYSGPYRGGHGFLHRQETIQGYGPLRETAPAIQAHRRDSVQATVGPGPSRDPAAGTTFSSSAASSSSSSSGVDGGASTTSSGSSSSSSTASSLFSFALMSLQRKDTVKKRENKSTIWRKEGKSSKKSQKS